MKKFTLISFLLLSLFAAKAQTSILEVVSPAGSYFVNEGAGISISWTLGEPVTATFVNEGAGIILTQGFQQGNMFATSLPENISSTFSAQIYPNPAKTEATIKVSAPGLAKVNVQVFDITGRIIIFESFEPTASEHQYKLNVSTLKQGIYLVKVSSGNKQQKVIKLIKE